MSRARVCREGPWGDNAELAISGMWPKTWSEVRIIGA